MTPSALLGATAEEIALLTKAEWASFPRPLKDRLLPFV